MAAGSWEDLRQRLQRLGDEAEVADLMVTSEHSTDGLRLFCFNSLAISTGEAFDLARRLADQVRGSGSGEGS